MAYEKGNGKTAVIALGGNALGNTPQEQLELVQNTAKHIVDMIQDGTNVVVSHGNGPQVGMINLGMATAAEAKAIKSDMPFPECGAMSQGYIGYHLQNAIGNELASRGMAKDVATVVTQVLVDEADPAFQHPTKPVGAFYDKETADRIAAEKGYTMVEDAGRGYRQVVPSPKPIDVIEKNTVKALVDNGTVVITVGGGGIPVVRKDGKLYGTPAVIDKDRSSALMAAELGADMLIILTAVEKVCINFNTPEQEQISEMTVSQAREYIAQGQFAPGSMLPKVEACIEYVEAYPEGKALITSLECAAAGLRGETGTVIINLCDAGGYRQFSNSKHPIKAPADLKGLKMRTNGMKTIDMTFQAMGATTTTIPYSDLYMGLKTSVADGQENPWVNVEGMKFYEVQKYFTEVNYQFHPDPFYVNAAWWNALPEEFRDVITECATAMGEYNDQLIDQNSSAAKQTIVDYGCEVYEPSADELKAFQQAVQSVYDKCISEGICTADELKEMQDIVAKA